MSDERSVSSIKNWIGKMSNDDCSIVYVPKQVVKEDEVFTNQKFWIENGIDLENRRIDLSEEIEEYSISMVVRAIRSMIAADVGEPIDIYISSYGGNVYDGLRLYDVIKAAEYTPIRTHAEGKVMSMGLIIYIAGQDDSRFSLPNTRFMAHSLSSGSWGKMRDLEVEVEECKRLNTRLIEILAENTKHTKKWWEKEIKHEDKYYDKSRAKTLGIVTNEKVEVV